MSFPSLLFMFLLASLYGIGFYLLFGRGWLMLGLYWLVALAGFAVGQLLGRVIGMSLLPVGGVNVFEGTLVSIVGLIAARAVYKK